MASSFSEGFVYGVTCLTMTILGFVGVEEAYQLYCVAGLVTLCVSLRYTRVRTTSFREL